MTHGSLFSGIGGFDLAAEWMGWENVFHCEISEFPRKILKHHFPNSICYEDIKKTDFTKHRGEIDIISGGFPCQPYSNAGKRRGKEDDRHLWPEMLRVIREVQPRFVVGENVAGLLSWNNGMVFHEIITDLKMKDMRHKRLLFQLVPRMPYTEEIESGLLPTPAVMDATNEGRKLTDGKSISFKTGIRYGIRLPQMANNQMLPTPMAVESIERRNMKTIIKIVETGSNQITLTTMAKYGGLLPTPMAQSRETTLEKTLERKEKYGGEKRAMYLENYAVMGMLPTPMASEGTKMSGELTENQMSLTKIARQGMFCTPTTQSSRGNTSDKRGKGNLTDQIAELELTTSKTSQLNPLFVAEMMGFPPNWTVLPFQSGETNQLRGTEMP